MQTIKKIIAAGLIGGSLVLAILIIGGKSLPSKSNPLAGFSTESVDGLKNSGYESIVENSTNQIAEDIAKELIARNPNGPVVEDGESFIGALDPEEMVGKIFEDQIGKIDLSEFAPKVEVARIQVVNSDQKSLAENYFKNFAAILNGNFSKLDANLESPISSDFSKVASALDKTVQDFYRLLTPKSLTAIHQQQIQLMLVQKAIYNSLAKYESDPLKALIATQLMGEVSQKLENLKLEIAAFISKNSLNI